METNAAPQYHKAARESAEFPYADGVKKKQVHPTDTDTALGHTNGRLIRIFTRITRLDCVVVVTG